MTFDSTTTAGDQARISSTSSSSESRDAEDSASERLDDLKSSSSPSSPPADCASSSFFSSITTTNSSSPSSSPNSDQHQSDQLEAHENNIINTNNNLNFNDDPNKLPSSAQNELKTGSSGTEAAANHRQTNNNAESGGSDNCYNQVLDDEIRSRLDRLNALSDLINSLERQFDEANSIFRDTLKCSSDRLSSIAKALGNKSIRQGRVYNAAKISVEQSQSDCQRACVQFEQANKDHQIAKNAIRDAELKLREIVGQTNSNGVIAIPNFSNNESIDISNLKLADSQVEFPKKSLNHHHQQNSSCDKNIESPAGDEFKGTFSSGTPTLLANDNHVPKPHSSNNNTAQETDAHGHDYDEMDNEKKPSSPDQMVKSAAKLSEELNQAIMKLIEAEKKRSLSERAHLDRANKLMVAQENLIRLERDFGQSIRRSQVYFDEAKRFDAKLNSVKGEICRISEEILAAKQAYAQTLSELEQFSDDLHDNSSSIFK